MNSEQVWEDQLKLGENSTVFNALVTQSPIAIAITDGYGNPIFANIQFSNFKNGLLSDLDLRIYLQDKPIVSIQNPNEKVFNVKRGNTEFELKRSRFNSANGTVKYLWQIQENEKQELLNKLGTLKDIYRSNLENTFEIILRTDFEGRINFSNRLFLKSLGFRAYKEAKTYGFEQLFYDKLHFKKLIDTLSQERKIENEQVVLKRLNDQKITCLVNACVYHDRNDSSAQQISWTILDVTNKVDSEHRLRNKNTELSKLNNQMERFLYSTSHDLRSPITSILGLINLMRFEVSDGLLKDYVDKIELSTTKLDKIIKDIMSFSKSNYHRTYSERIDFEAFTWKVINAFHDDQAFKKINFEVKTSLQFPFYSDPERMEIIFENIIRNCIHFYDVNKTKPFVKITIGVNKAESTIEFLDNGIGIGQHHLTNIFSMFYKASHLSKGAGLGLFIVNETLEKMNGKIDLQSEIGFGTVIRITIPNDHKGKLINRKLELHKEH